MWSSKPRVALFSTALLDLVGLIVLLVILKSYPELMGMPYAKLSFSGQYSWIYLASFLYLFNCWLFGSYAFIRHSSVSISRTVLSISASAAAFILILAFFRWLINPSDFIWILYRRVQVAWVVLLSVWSILIRLLLRNRLLSPDPPLIILVNPPEGLSVYLNIWNEIPGYQQLRISTIEKVFRYINVAKRHVILVLTQTQLDQEEFSILKDKLKTSDPRKLSLITPSKLIELAQERITPYLLQNHSLLYSDLPWTSPFSVEAQLKRCADVIVSCFLLLLSSPIIIISAVLILIEDGTPVFYTQTRTGWLGKTFRLYKLRTMTTQASNTNAPNNWTQISDPRITTVGKFLRMFRIDELPQLYNVLEGTMSLIGPRPERPQYDSILEEKIPNYSKRYWMRPGLSGWAQVNAPYASTVRDSSIKLSYDLYYLKHFGTWLDILILFKTLKIILHANGR